VDVNTVKAEYRASLDRSYIGQVERGETNISLLNICHIADALGIGADRIVKRCALGSG
jgi:transcriptional regulator with XRE-family HTH domain